MKLRIAALRGEHEIWIEDDGHGQFPGVLVYDEAGKEIGLLDITTDDDGVLWAAIGGWNADGEWLPGIVDEASQRLVDEEEER